MTPALVVVVPVLVLVASGVWYATVKIGSADVRDRTVTSARIAGHKLKAVGHQRRHPEALPA